MLLVENKQETSKKLLSVKNKQEAYKNFIEMSRNYDDTTGNLFDYLYPQKYY